MQVDAEIGEEERKADNITINNLDIIPEEFIVGGRAWKLCRGGKHDPNKFGVCHLQGIQGWWFIRADLLRDLWCLKKIELVSWDYTEYIDNHFKELSELPVEELNLLDRLADCTITPGVEGFRIISDLYSSESRLQVGKTITSYPDGDMVRVTLD